jgi:hypothetical protein
MKDEWTPYEFKNYLKRHMLTPIKPIRIHGDQYRARIRPPAYKSYITKVLHTKYNRPSMISKFSRIENLGEDRKVYMVMGVGEPNERFNLHKHDFSYQNIEIK